MYGQKRSVKVIAEEIKGLCERAQPYDLTFSPFPGTTEEKQVLEAHLAERFRIWYESWIIPNCDEIIAKYDKKGG